MRPPGIVVTDHDLLVDVGEEDHHVTVAPWKTTINALSIAPGQYSHNIALGKSGCRTVQGILRGHLSVDIQGHTGVFVLATDTAQQSSAIGIRPYPSGTQSYVGGYSRLHGDSYLSHRDFGSYVYLVDAYISGSNLVLSFFNTHATLSKNLTVFGSGICK